MAPLEAFNMLLKEAENGDAEAQFQVGEIYRMGQTGVPQNPSEAEHWYRQASEQDHEEARYELGVLLYNEENGVRLPEAIHCFLLGVDAGHALSFYMLGTAYLHGQGVEKSPQQAAELISVASDHGISEAQYTLGLMYAKGIGFERDEEKGIQLMAMAAVDGDVGAIKGLIAYYRIKMRIKPEEHKIEELCNVAKISDPESQYKIGLNILTTPGIPKDMWLSVDLFTIAAQKNHPSALYMLGLAYHDGIAVQKDIKQSLTLLQQSAELGHPDAQYALGSFYYEGKIVEGDEEKAKKYFLMAAKQKHPQAAHALREIFSQTQL